MMTRLIRNRRGQVAIFIALLFQVLFLFFAMIVNVGLLVHHKINLQNSVDLAAYYGAMKQAEVLNAISHVNYQIRQSWKLLVWRHRVLGSAGADSPENVLPIEKMQFNQAVNEVLAGDSYTKYQNMYKLPRFCITFAPHEVTGSSQSNENSCKRMYESTTNVSLPNPNIISYAGFLSSIGGTVQAALQNAINQAGNRCAVAGSLNYVTAARMVIGHTIEAEERAYLINYLATGLSSQDDDFYELNGDSAKIGLEKTLKKNLTDANAASLQNVQILNGLAIGPCKAGGGGTGTTKANMPKWLVPIEVYPVWRYADCQSSNNGQTITGSPGKQLSSDPAQLPAERANAPADLQTMINNIVNSGILSGRTTLVGFEKDPWCISYVGVKATTKPKIPFMPLSEIEMSAEAYAKPFGGRIGPWYVKTWQPSEVGDSRINNTANGYKPDALEPNGPIRVSDVAGITNLDDPGWVPNISRFIGEPRIEGGYAIERFLAYFHRAIRGFEGFENSNQYYQNIGQGATFPYPIVSEVGPSLKYYDGVGVPYNQGLGTAGDQLTWSADNGGAPRLRLLEIAAIAPSLFDMAYYSIEPDFYNNYYTQIEASKTKRGWDSNRVILPDVGGRLGNSTYVKFNIIDQIKIQRALSPPGALDSNVSMPWALKKTEHLLNSWAVDDLRDYRTNTDKFGKCLSPDSGATSIFETPLNPPTPGNCVDGGRVGFSVKMVSKDYLKSGDLQLGGEGTSGKIRNELPSGW